MFFTLHTRIIHICRGTSNVEHFQTHHESEHRDFLDFQPPEKAAIALCPVLPQFGNFLYVFRLSVRTETKRKKRLKIRQKTRHVAALRTIAVPPLLPSEEKPEAAP